MSKSWSDNDFLPWCTNFDCVRKKRLPGMFADHRANTKATAKVKVRNNATAEEPPRGIDTGRVVEIVSSYVRHHRIASGELAGLIVEVHRVLAGLGRAATGQEVPEPAVPIRGSVHQDYVVCLECGYRAQMLRRHLRVAHGLEVADYRAPLAIAAGSSIDGAGLFGATFDTGQSDRSRAARARGTEAAGNRADAGGGTTGAGDWCITARNPAWRPAAAATAGVLTSARYSRCRGCPRRGRCCGNDL